MSLRFEKCATVPGPIQSAMPPRAGTFFRSFTMRTRLLGTVSKWIVLAVRRIFMSLPDHADTLHGEQRRLHVFDRVFRGSRVQAVAVADHAHALPQDFAIRSFQISVMPVTLLISPE